METVPEQRLQELLMFLNAKAKSARAKGFDQLSNVKIYPDIIPNTDDYYPKVLVPVMKHLDDPSDAVREKCALCLTALIQQLGKKALDNTIDACLPSILMRLLSEQVEEASIVLLKLLLYLIELVGPDTYPSTWDNYADSTAKVLAVTLKSSDSHRKNLSSKIFMAMAKRIEGHQLKELAPLVIKSFIPNLKHRQQEVRRNTLIALAEFYVITGSEEETDNIAQLIEKLSDDRTNAVRMEVINFIKTLLIRHEARHTLYQPFILTLFSLAQPLVPLRRIEEYEEVKQPEVTEIETSAWEAIEAIAKQHENDKEEDYRKELQYLDNRLFDETREISVGLLHIVQDNFVRMMDHLIPKLSDWTEQTRLFGFRAIITLLHIAGPYSTRYTTQMLQALATSIRDIRGDNIIALRCAAVFCANVPGDDLVVFLVPKLSSEGPKEIIMLLQVALVNAQFNDGALATIVTAINDQKVYESYECINNTAQAVLAMIEKSKEFREINTMTLLTTILRICEKGDALHYFEKCFERPISVVFAEQMSGLLTVTDKTPKFLSQLLLTAPAEAVARSSGHVCQAIVESLGNCEPEDVTAIMQLIIDLCGKKALPDIDADLLNRILEQMEWRAGKDYFEPRSKATLAFASLLEVDSITAERVDAEFEEMIPRVIGTMDDCWSDEVRSASMRSTKAFFSKCTKLATKFDDIFKVLRERLDDHLLPVRVKSMGLMAQFLLQCQSVEAVPSKWSELLIFIDDEAAEMREAVGQFALEVAKVDAWKDGLRTALEEVVAKNYHEEATILGKELIEKLK